MLDHFGRFVDIVVDGGPTSDVPSTVLEVTDDEVVVLREGRGPIEGILDA